MVKHKSKVKNISDLVKNSSQVSKPNIIWEIDLVYFFKNNNTHNLKQEVYLVLLDRFSRYCLFCKNVTNSQTSENFIKIVQIFLETCEQTPYILHSDFGTQFSSKLWQNFSNELKNTYNINLSISGKKAFNTYGINIFMNSCRSNYWNKFSLNLGKSSSTKDIDLIVQKSIKLYNNSKLNIFNKSTKAIKTNNTPKSIYQDKAFNYITPILTAKVKYPYKPEQKYIELIVNYMKNNLNIVSIENLDYTDYVNIAKSALTSINILKNYNSIAKKYTIKKQKRDIIEKKEILNILELKDVYVTKSNKINKLMDYRILQLKIGIIVLYLTGCRIGEVEQFTFKTINQILKKGFISVIAPKDKTTREIHIKNTQFLLKLDTFYTELINLYTHTNVYFNQNSPMFHKLKSHKTFYTVEFAKYGYLKNLINDFFKNYTTSHNISKVWSTHSFRHTVITKLIDKQGIINTKIFIGHKDTKTTELYYHAKNNNKVLLQSAELL